MKFKEAITKAKEASKDRKFKQTVEMIVNLKGVDPKNLSINDAYKLPAGIGKKRIICAVGSGDFIIKAKKAADIAIDKKEIGKYSNKKKAKELAKQVDFFVVEMSMMGEFAKALGTVLGPRGKMPLPKHILSFDTDPTNLIKELKDTARIVAKKSAVVQLVLGSEEMADEGLAENAEHLYEILAGKLERHAENIKNIHIKLTMGKPVKVE